MLVIPLTVTEIGPVVAPVGTFVVMLVDVSAVTNAAVPLKFTICPTELGSDGLKLVPVIITVVPTEPDTGLNEIIDGFGGVFSLLQEKNPTQTVKKTKKKRIFFIISIKVILVTPINGPKRKKFYGSPKFFSLRR